MKTVFRTRFAPSPTGFQHIGGFRTAMWSWLLAKQSKGQFILRIEDTDQERCVSGAIRYLVNSLDWLGINYDEGPSHEELKKINEDCPDIDLPTGPFAPYIQSSRAARHKEIAEELVVRGKAYRCDCSSEDLAEQRRIQQEQGLPTGYSGRCRNRQVGSDTKHVIRLIIPSNQTFTLNDRVRGTVTWENPTLRDPVLLKSDGMATYHLAAMVDDYDMQITHVLRGEEWLSSYPIHFLVYEGMGWPMPEFAHFSLILGPDGKKLSKRHGAESLDYFREQGFLPEALINYMVRIGWSLADGDDQEIFSRQELIEKFSLDRLSRSGGVFDMEKLLWTNSQYLHKLDQAEFTRLARPYFEKAGYVFMLERWQGLVKEIQQRCRVLSDVVSVAGFLFAENVTFDPQVVLKKVDPETTIKIIKALSEKLGHVVNFSTSEIEQELQAIASQLGIKPAPVFQITRLAISGTLASPPLPETIAALGKAETLRRLQTALKIY